MAKRQIQQAETNTHLGIISKPYIATLNIELLKVPRFNEKSHRGYQRELCEAWVNHLIEIWSDQLCGLLEVVHRPDDTFAVTDGGHRLECMIRKGYETVLCRVRDTDGSVEAEAWLFEHFNKQRKGMSPFNMMMAALKHKDPLAMSILDIVKKSNYRITSKRIGKDDQTTGVISAINKMYSLAKKNLVIFERIFPIAAGVHGGGRIDNRTLNGLFALEGYLQAVHDKGQIALESVADPDNMKKLIKMGADAFFDSIHKCEGPKSGNNVAHAQINALIYYLNRGRRDDKLIPYSPRGRAVI